MYKGYTCLRHRKGSRDTKAPSYRPTHLRRPWDLPSYNEAHHADLAGQAEVSLVGVWMSDDINPKLIHRIPLSDADPKTLEKFVDKQGYLYGAFPVRGCFVPCRLDARFLQSFRIQS